MAQTQEEKLVYNILSRYAKKKGLVKYVYPDGVYVFGNPDNQELAALLEVIREKVGCDLSIWEQGYNIDVYDLESGKAIAELYSNPIDAAVETIYKLKENNLL